MIGPDAAEVLACLDRLNCSTCRGLGVVVDATPIAGMLWLIAWRTEHTAGCSGRSYPEMAYTVDVERLARGDFALPAPPVSGSA